VLNIVEEGLFISQDFFPFMPRTQLKKVPTETFENNNKECSQKNPWDVEKRK